MTHKRQLILILHNIRSIHNVGSLIRSADGLAAEVICSGYTPYPSQTLDSRLPHLHQKITSQINKTSLGAHLTTSVTHEDTIEKCLARLRAEGFIICALEQSPVSISLPDFQPAEKLAIILGREVEGIEPEVLKLADQVVEIPMFGQKESFNVAVAGAIALYHCRFYP